MSASIHDLILGYQRFRKDKFPERHNEFATLARKQSPQVLFVTCSDSRVVPDVIFQAQPGDLFVCRVIGNIVPPHGEPGGAVSSAVEYAVRVLQVNAIVVCGHSDCGAMKALMHPELAAELPAVSAWLTYAARAKQIGAEHYSSLEESELLEALIEENVLAQIANLETHPVVASRLRTGDLKLYGWVYEIGTGEVLTYDAQQGRFVALDSHSPTAEVSSLRKRAARHTA